MSELNGRNGPVRTYLYSTLFLTILPLNPPRSAIRP